MIVGDDHDPLSGKYLCNVGNCAIQDMIFNIYRITVFSEIDCKFHKLWPALYKDFPTTVAIWDIFFTNSLYFSGFRDCAPSQSAHSGLL